MFDAENDVESLLAQLQPRGLSDGFADNVERRLTEPASPAIRQRRLARWSAVTVTAAAVVGVAWLAFPRLAHRSSEYAPAGVTRSSRASEQDGPAAIRGDVVRGPHQPRGDHVAVLVQQLSHQDNAVQVKAARELASIRPLDATAIPALIAALDNTTPNSPLRIYAAWALDGTGAPGGEAVKARLLAKLRAASLVSRDLNEIHNLRTAAIPALIELLKDADRDRRARGLGLLTGVAPHAPAAAPAVRKCLTDQDAGIRVAAARCLWTLTGDTANTVPLLIAVLKTPLGPDAYWSDAADVLGDIGPPAHPAVAALIELLAGTKEKLSPTATYRGPPFPLFHIRESAATALGKIGSGAKAAVPALIKAAQQPDAGRQSAARLRVLSARAVWLIEPAHRQAMTLVQGGLDEPYPLNRNAAETLLLIGPSAKQTVPRLIELLNGENRDCQWAAICALGMIGEAARPAADRLDALSNGKDRQLQMLARLAAARVTEPAQSPLPLLQAALKITGDNQVRQLLSARVEAARADRPQD